jgi:hypothetical protein
MPCLFIKHLVFINHLATILIKMLQSPATIKLRSIIKDQFCHSRAFKSKHFGLGTYNKLGSNNDINVVKTYEVFLKDQISNKNP